MNGTGGTLNCNHYLTHRRGNTGLAVELPYHRQRFRHMIRNMDRAVIFYLPMQVKILKTGKDNIIRYSSLCCDGTK